MAKTLTDTTLAAVERALNEVRREGVQRTSVMTHIVWAPAEWLKAAERTLAGLSERHPSRTILLTPAPRRKSGIDAVVDVRTFTVDGSDRSIASEVVELTLKGERAKAPGSIVMPLLITDLPVFCRWRGEPEWESPELEQLVGVIDRLVVDSGEWPGLPDSYASVAALFDRVAVSDIAWSRTAGWRRRLSGALAGYPPCSEAAGHGARVGCAPARRLAAVAAAPAVELSHRPAKSLRRVAVDGTSVEAPPGPARSGPCPDHRAPAATSRRRDHPRRARAATRGARRRSRPPR